jgi:hypothetical protein
MVGNIEEQKSTGENSEPMEEIQEAHIHEDIDQDMISHGKF